MANYKEILSALSSAPDGQIDVTMTVKLKALSEEDNPKADDLHEILDECAYASLASVFAMVAMDTVWRRMLKDEGRTVEQAMKDRRPRGWELE